ncbi:HAD family phosphatase [Bacteroides sp. 51]|uniref:HAD family hydrolase n=1 Tax=Bacteroides sp. 51 TaxID=2302938 RepID=UPI0013D766AF|nr:HAD family phosphatase [Bacteroides sp. 51]NDV82199.1 HAD family phosphatase [Bacteroides sp. 51]
MRKKGIKNIIFDFGGVLINLNRQRCIDSFKQLGLNHVEDLIDPFAQQGIFMQLEKGLITPAVFRDKVREQLNEPATDEQIDAAWNNFLVDLPTYKLEALLKLRERYLVYLLSNTNAIHWDWSCANAFPYKGFNEKDYFEEIFLSYEMKLAKPDVAIFEAVLEATGIQAKETFFIDDSEANCKAAESLGISTYLCKPGEDWTKLF